MGAGRKGEVQGIEEGNLVQPWLNPFGVVVRDIGRERHFRYIHGLVCASNRKITVTKLDIFLSSFQGMGRYLLALGNNLVTGVAMATPPTGSEREP